MTAPLAPQYDPSEIEAPLYAWWRERDLFSPEGAARARGGPAGEPYVIQMPPPNVTAELHTGHGLNNTVQDVLVRFERMRGRRALWVPGTDHAGIATQNVVERLLAKAARPTGPAPTSPWTRTSPAPCARCSSGCTRRA
jgi:valyl-tRNA synthetase